MKTMSSVSTVDSTTLGSMAQDSMDATHVSSSPQADISFNGWKASILDARIMSSGMKYPYWFHCRISFIKFYLNLF